MKLMRIPTNNDSGQYVPEKHNLIACCKEPQYRHIHEFRHFLMGLLGKKQQAECKLLEQIFQKTRVHFGQELGQIAEVAHRLDEVFRHSEHLCIVHGSGLLEQAFKLPCNSRDQQGDVPGKQVGCFHELDLYPF